VVISAIDGIPGVGKTALAVCWAHRVAEQFPDGQLYVNLRGFDPSSRPTTPGEAIRGFLHGFGVPPERIPASTEAQAALYRTLTAGKRLLVVLDNARDADQVWPLLPGSPGCLVLVTSRARLLGLVAAYGTHLLALDLPSRSEARGLLAGRLGLAAMAAEPQAADELIRLCARLPLALGLAAARAAARPGFPLATLAAELRETTGRLDALNAGNGGGNVRAVFSWSLQGLCAPAARMFRLLSVHPGPDISVPAAASLAGVPWPQARAVLRELVDGSLVTERAPGRYTLHDLLRVYAAEQAAACETDEDRRAAACRMLDHYLHSAGAAARAVEPDHDLPPDGPLEPGVTPEVVTGRDQSLAWFDAEHKVILEVIGRAAEARFDARAQQMSWTLVMWAVARPGRLAVCRARVRAATG
jgi:hypothetical protein